MTVKITKPSINVRSELSELRKPSGTAGEAMLRAETPQEQFNLIGAGRRNMIINGAMKVAQRGTSKTGVSSSGYYTVDRWAFYPGSVEDSLDYTMSQSTDAPDGFANSLKMECTTTGTIDSSHNVYVRQFFEAQDIQHIGFGTSNAQPFTVSFWVKCSKTGLFTLSIFRTGTNRTTGLAYTVNSANTWEYKTLTFQPDTTGAVNNDNGNGMQVAFFMTAGSGQKLGTFTNGNWESYNVNNYASSGQVNIATDGDTFAITGVQLELGKVATPFEHRSYGEELALCQRYYYRVQDMTAGDRVGSAFASTSSSAQCFLSFPTSMRTNPTGSYSGAAGWSFGTSGGTYTASGLTLSANKTGSLVILTISGATAGYGGQLRATSSTSTLSFDAEL